MTLKQAPADNPEDVLHEAMHGVLDMWDAGYATEAGEHGVVGYAFAALHVAAQLKAMEDDLKADRFDVAAQQWRNVLGDIKGVGDVPTAYPENALTEGHLKDASRYLGLDASRQRIDVKFKDAYGERWEKMKAAVKDLPPPGPPP